MSDLTPHDSLAVEQAIELKKRARMFRLANVFAIPCAVMSLGGSLIFVLGVLLDLQTTTQTVLKNILKLGPPGALLLWVGLGGVLFVQWNARRVRKLEHEARRLIEGDAALVLLEVKPSEPTPLMLQEADRMTRSIWHTRFKRTGSVGVVVLSSVFMCGGGGSLLASLVSLWGVNPGMWFLLGAFVVTLLGFFGVLTSVKRSEKYKDQADFFAQRRTHLVEGKVHPGALQISVDAQDGGGLTLESQGGELAQALLDAHGGEQVP